MMMVSNKVKHKSVPEHSYTTVVSTVSQPLRTMPCHLAKTGRISNPLTGPSNGSTLFFDLEMRKTGPNLLKRASRGLRQPCGASKSASKLLRSGHFGPSTEQSAVDSCCAPALCFHWLFFRPHAIRGTRLSSLSGSSHFSLLHATSCGLCCAKWHSTFVLPEGRR